MPEAGEGDVGNTTESLPRQMSNIWKSLGYVDKECGCVLKKNLQRKYTKERFIFEHKPKLESINSRSLKYH